jgi:uncharacterized RDD family membrane protein YckC/Tfp pilus assembly major pilin PilA
MSDAIWHHTDAAGGQHGPLTAEAIRAGLASGGIPADARFWRYGLADWVDRAAVAAELGLPPPAPRLDPYAAPASPVSERAASDAVVYAGFVRRLAALLLDRLILGVPLGVVFVLLVVAMMPTLRNGRQPGPLLVLGFYALYFTVSALYHALQEASSAQATLGKRALGIKVTDDAGRRLTFAHALGRWFAAALSYLTAYVGFLMAAFSDRKRALHDIVAGTLVVDQWAYTGHPERQQRETSGCLVALVVGIVLVVPVGAILAAISISQYQDFVSRSQFSEAPSIADGLKTQVAEVYAATGACPVNGEAGFGPPTDYAGKYVAQVEVGGTAPACVLTATFRNDDPVTQVLRGRTVTFTGTDAGGRLEWRCESTIAAKFKPTTCR